jgi:hypothetical protein
MLRLKGVVVSGQAANKVTELLAYRFGQVPLLEASEHPRAQ